MTAKEFSYEFDLIYNNISSNIMAPGINEYEKSVFLTRALLDLVMELSDSYELDELSALYLKELLVTLYLTIPAKEGSLYKISIPGNCIKMCNLVVNDDHSILVIATKVDYLYRNLKNPFKRPSAKRCLKVIEDNKLTLFTDQDITKLSVTYISKPTPIITEDLTSYRRSIDGLTNEMTSELHENLHYEIARRAATMAANIYKSK